MPMASMIGRKIVVTDQDDGGTFHEHTEDEQDKDDQEDQDVRVVRDAQHCLR